LQQDLATAYIKLGDIQGSPRQADLGDAAGARASYGKALAILEAMLPAQPNERPLHLLAASGYTRLAAIAPAQQATDLLGKALRIEQDLAARNPGDVKLRQELGSTYEELSLHFGNPYALNYVLGARQGLDYANQALQIREQLYREAPNDPGALFDLFEAYHYVADNLWVTGHLDQALDNEMKIRSMMVDFIDRNPTNAEAKRLLVTGDGRIAKVLEESGQLSKALARLEAPFQGIMSLGEADPKNILVKRQMASGYNQMGELLLKLGKLDRAVEYHRTAVKLSEAVLAADPTNFDSRYRLATSYQALGNALASKGSAREATEDSSKAVEIRRVLVSGDPSDARGRYALAKNLLHLGSIQANASPGAALQSYLEGIATLEPMVKVDPDNWIMERTLADLYSRSGVVALGMGMAPSQSASQRSCSFFSQELSLWRDMRQHNVLIAADLPRLEKAEGRLHDCSVTEISAELQR
jgi:eukaryotic-like serine/threonine-protein kinase